MDNNAIAKKKQRINSINMELKRGSYNFTRKNENMKMLAKKIEAYTKNPLESRGFMRERGAKTLRLYEELEKASSALRPPNAAAASGANGAANGAANSAANGAVWVPKAMVPNAPKKVLTAADLDRWIPWSDYPNDVPFKLEVKESGIGNGEYKLAEILGTKPLGQNVSYDLDLCIEALCSRGEVKELDSANSFRSGVKGADLYRPIKYKISDLQKIIQKFNEDFTGTLNPDLTEVILSMSPGEIGAGNLANITMICRVLHDIKFGKVNSKRIYDIFDILTGKPKKVHSNVLYKMLIAEGRPLNEIKKVLGDEEFNKERINELLDHPYINDPLELKNTLDAFPSILFNGLTLVFVHETKGFYIVSNTASSVKLNRITQDKPRFKAAV